MSLELISHSQLLECALKLGRDSQACNSALLSEYLREIERRKLHTELGYGSAADLFSAELGICARPTRRRASA